LAIFTCHSPHPPPHTHCTPLFHNNKKAQKNSPQDVLVADYWTNNRASDSEKRQDSSADLFFVVHLIFRTDSG